MAEYIPITFTKDSLTKNPSGALRVAQLTTLFDGEQPPSKKVASKLPLNF